MRTTLELPDEILKRAKVAAIERGSTLREVVAEALAKELGMELSSTAAPRRASFPLFSSKRPGKLKLGNAGVAEIERAEDRRRDGLPR